jgi:hypothetical protein
MIPGTITGPGLMSSGGPPIELTYISSVNTGTGTTMAYPSTNDGDILIATRMSNGASSISQSIGTGFTSAVLQSNVRAYASGKSTAYEYKLAIIAYRLCDGTESGSSSGWGNSSYNGHVMHQYRPSAVPASVNVLDVFTYGGDAATSSTTNAGDSALATIVILLANGDTAPAVTFSPSSDCHVYSGNGDADNYTDLLGQDAGTSVDVSWTRSDQGVDNVTNACYLELVP